MQYNVHLVILLISISYNNSALIYESFKIHDSNSTIQNLPSVMRMADHLSAEFIIKSFSKQEEPTFQ